MVMLLMCGCQSMNLYPQQLKSLFLSQSLPLLYHQCLQDQG